jgi:hypothetical protein
MIKAIKLNLETPLIAPNGNQFVIPADLALFLRGKICIKLSSKQLNGSLEEIALLLEESYNKLLTKTQEELNK